MSDALRAAWAHGIHPDDYDVHMINVGQAMTNALIVSSFFDDCKLVPHAKVWFAGAGTGQMFDFIDPKSLSAYDCILTDISESFISKLKSRVGDQLSSARFLIDDVECTSLQNEVDVVVLVLVLEHVDWKKALSQTAKLQPNHLLIVIQENPSDLEEMLAPNRVLPPTIEKYKDVPGTHLIDRTELREYLDSLGFDSLKETPHIVPDGKTMWEIRVCRSSK